jgi:hypothetical protein
MQGKICGDWRKGGRKGEERCQGRKGVREERCQGGKVREERWEERWEMGGKVGGKEGRKGEGGKVSGERCQEPFPSPFPSTTFWEERCQEPFPLSGTFSLDHILRAIDAAGITNPEPRGRGFRGIASFWRPRKDLGARHFL